MNYLHDHPHASRVLLAALTAMALLVAMSAAAAAEPITSDQFSPGWQSDAKPLYWVGMQPQTGRDRYYVPALLPRGDYVLIKRTGDKAEVMDYRFTVSSGNATQYLFLESGLAGSIEAVPIRDVPALKPQPGTASLR